MPSELPILGTPSRGDAGAGAQAVDLLVSGHEREKIGNARLRGEVRIVEGITRLLRNGGSEHETGKTDQVYEVFFHDMPKLIKWNMGSD